jgi:hypothetical protein
MTLDDRLKRAVDTLGDRLRDEMTRELRRVTEELSAEAQAQREAAVQAALASQPPPPAPVAEPPPALNAVHRVLDGVRAIDNARTLTEVLDALLSGAVAESSLAGVLLIRGEKATGWRENRSFELPLAEMGVVDAVRLRLAENGPMAIEAQVIPLSLGGETIATLYAEGGDAGALEILARHASRVLETLTAFKTARAVAGTSSSAASASADPVDGEGDEAAARRYARLLISEIKLYHQDDVEAGQRDRDLYQRLGGEIARARTLYHQRVPSHVAGAADYFRDELVRTLAGGDASLLVDVSAA